MLAIILLRIIATTLIKMERFFKIIGCFLGSEKGWRQRDIDARECRQSVASSPHPDGFELVTLRCNVAQPAEPHQPEQGQGFLIACMAHNFM